MTNQITCELCTELGAEIIYQGAQWHVVVVDDAHYPGFCRVIWNDHVKEMTDLSAAERASLMDAVWQVEAAIRTVMRPDTVRKYASEAGFADVTVLPIEHDMFRFYQLS